MVYFPINLNLQNQPVVVIGGGQVGLRKIRNLLRAGASLKVIEPQPTSVLIQMGKKKTIQLIQRPYRSGDLKGALLGIASTENPTVQESIVREAHSRKIWLNVVDKPSVCDFVFPAVFTRGDLMMAISTGGTSPALAKKIRQDLEKIFGEEYTTLLKLLKSLRGRVVFKNFKDRSKRFENFLKSPVLQFIRARDKEAIRKLVQASFGKEAG